jgi:hypothetical protein
MKILFSATAIAAVLAAPAHAAASLPDAVRGDWHHTAPINNGTEAVPFPAIIGADTYHEAGYNCQVKSAQQTIDPADRQPIYAVDMMCATEQEHPYPLKTFWALRKTAAGDVLVITALPLRGLGPSIEVLEKGDGQ